MTQEEPSTGLARAEALEVELRVRLAELIRERRHAHEEADRLGERGRLPGADAALTESAERYRARASVLDREIEAARERLRAQEGAVARRRADEDLGPAGGAVG